MRDDRVYLLHIRECLGRIDEYTSGGRDEFLADRKTQDAVLRNLQTLAESTQRLPETLKATRPDIPWRQIAAFRNVLVHDYLGINLELVWDVVVRDLPPLYRAIDQLLSRG